MKRIDSIIWTLLFALFAWFQVNDPDAAVWILVYGSAAVVSIISYSKKLPLWIYGGLAIISLIGAIWLWPDQYQGLTLEHGYTPAIEEARESLGLVTCLLGMLWLAWRAY